MTYKVAAATANAMVDAEKVLLNTGYLRVYAGTKPTNPDTALSGQTLLAEFRFQATAFGASSAGTAAAASITSVTAAASGTASWFRVLKSDGTTVVGDGDVTATGGGGDITFDNVSFISGGTVNCTGFSLTEPAD